MVCFQPIRFILKRGSFELFPAFPGFPAKPAFHFETPLSALSGYVTVFTTQTKLARLVH